MVKSKVKQPFFKAELGYVRSIARGGKPNPAGLIPNKNPRNPGQTMNKQARLNMHANRKQTGPQIIKAVTADKWNMDDAKFAFTKIMKRYKNVPADKMKDLVLKDVKQNGRVSCGIQNKTLVIAR